MHPALFGILIIVFAVLACGIYFYGSNFLLDKFIAPARAFDAKEAGRRRLLGFGLLVGVPALFAVFRLASGADLGIWLIAGGILAALAFAASRLFPAGAQSLGDNINRANQIRPWLFLFPALFFLSLYLAYPVFETLRLSLLERQGADFTFVGTENYQRMFAEGKFHEALYNNVLWLIVVPAMATGFGLLIAQLTDGISWGGVAKSIIFMPMAISFVGAAVIWKLIYDTRPEDQPQIGILNAIWLQFSEGGIAYGLLQLLPALLLGVLVIGVLYVAYLIALRVFGAGLGFWARGAAIVGIIALGWVAIGAGQTALGALSAELAFGKPQTWLTVPLWNNFFLMFVLIWIETGFAMVILSAALRGIPEETVEAAIVDGANPFQIFFQIKVPQIMGTIVVVWTTITIKVLKVFDIVFAMTNGQWETQVMANYMFDKLFRANDWGVGAASAMIIMLMVTPILIWNIVQTRKEHR